MGDIAHEAPGTPGTAPSVAGIRTLPVASLAPHPEQPRRYFDEDALDELARSIAARGLIQPIVVRPHGHDYQIVAGDRRWRAAQRGRLHAVRVIVRDFNDSDTIEIAQLENIPRAARNVIEEAEADRKMIAKVGQ